MIPACSCSKSRCKKWCYTQPWSMRAPSCTPPRSGRFLRLENGRRRPLRHSKGDVPVGMGIVIDNSGSMRDKRDKVNQAVSNLIRASNPQDEIFVVNFSQNYYLDQDFTSDPDYWSEHCTKFPCRQYSALRCDSGLRRPFENNPRLDKKVLLVITMARQHEPGNSRRGGAPGCNKACPTLYAIGLMGGDLRDPGMKLCKDSLTGRAGGVFPAKPG